MVQERIKQFMEIHDSLTACLRQAGGGLMYGSALQNMSAFELLELLAPNGIRFCNTTRPVVAECCQPLPEPGDIRKARQQAEAQMNRHRRDREEEKDARDQLLNKGYGYVGH